MPIRRTSVVLCLLMLIFAVSNLSASDFTEKIFEETFRYEKGAGPISFTREIKPPYEYENCILYAVNGEKSAERVVKGNIRLNGVLLTDEAHKLTRFTDKLAIPVTLAPGPNVLSVEFQGSTHANLKITLEGRPALDIALLTTPAPAEGRAPLTVGFKVKVAKGKIARYLWDLDGDGQFVPGPDPARGEAWQTYSSGTYTASVKAVHVCGLESPPCGVEIKVSAPVNVSVDVPNPGAGFVAINAAANVTDGSGSITSVDFYVDDTLVKTSYSRPHYYYWNTSSVPEGNHKIRAVANATVGQGFACAETVVRHYLPTLTVSKPYGSCSHKARATLTRCVDGVLSPVTEAALTFNGTVLPYQSAAGEYVQTDLALSPGAPVEFRAEYPGMLAITENFVMPLTATDIRVLNYENWPSSGLEVTWTPPAELNFSSWAIYIYFHEASDLQTAKISKSYPLPLQKINKITIPPSYFDQRYPYVKIIIKSTVKKSYWCGISSTKKQEFVMQLTSDSPFWTNIPAN